MTFFDEQDEDSYYEEEVDFGEEELNEVKKSKPVVEDKDEPNPFATVTNTQDANDFMGMINISNVKRVEVKDDEERVEIVDTFNIKETVIKPNMVDTETPEVTEEPKEQTPLIPIQVAQPTTLEGVAPVQVKAYEESSAELGNIFATGLTVEHKEDKSEDLTTDLDKMYEKAEEVQENVTVPDIEDDADSDYFLFGAIFGNDVEGTKYRKELMLEFNANNIFEDEFYVLYRILHDYARIRPNKQFISTYLQNHQAIYQNIPNVNISKFRLGENDPYIEFIQSCLYVFEKCEALEVDENDFFLHLELKKMTFINAESIKTFAEATEILTDGLGKGKYAKKGYVDMRMHVNKTFTKLDNLMHKTNRKGMIVYGKTAMEDDENRSRLLFKFGIKALDEALGGINEGMMVSLLAPPKGFKTRLSSFILHNAIISGVNSLVWSLENGYKGVECLVRARHYYWYYQENGLNEDGLLDINAKDIQDGTLPPDIAELEQASWLDLQTNPEYGLFVNMDEPFELDTFTDRLEESIKLHNVQFIELDYLQLVDGGNDGMAKNERVGTAYQRTLRLLKNNNVAGLMPGQIKQSVINELSRLNYEELSEYELRDAGAESSEVIRTPDLNIMIYGTKTMIDQGKSYLLSVPSRYSKPFQPIKLAVKAQHCTFASVPNDAW